MSEEKIYYRCHLPHYQPTSATFHVVFRLAGSLPIKVIERLRLEREEALRRIVVAAEGQERIERRRSYEYEYFKKFDALLDRDSMGPRWLNQPDVAEIVKQALHDRDGKAYDLLVYCIMPNHVHVVLTLVGRDSSRPEGDTGRAEAGSELG